jgi:hypothetical protein
MVNILEYLTKTLSRLVFLNETTYRTILFLRQSLLRNVGLKMQNSSFEFKLMSLYMD